MRILHTADLHLGRTLGQLSLEEDHAHILSQIFDALTAQAADVLLIAGDIFDRATPPARSVSQFNAFLRRVVDETSCAVVAMAGNHDQADRIGAMGVMTDPARALIRGELRADEPALVLHDAHGPVAFSALPFAFEYAARACFGDERIATPEDVIAAQVASARRAVPPGARWVVAAHAFVAGGTGTEAERPLARVGGIENVRPSVFDGADYVALGHLHRPQTVGAPHIRYSGAPLAFGFDEAGAQKSLSLVDLGPDGAASVTELPLAPLRPVEVLRGTFAELLALPPSPALLRAELSDPTPVIDAMPRLRAVFPNTCQIAYTARASAPEVKSAPSLPARSAPSDVVDAFVTHVRGSGLTEAEISVTASAFGRLAAASREECGS